MRMMRPRSLLSRSLWFGYGLWFALSVGGPAAELSCPEHSHAVASAVVDAHAHHAVGAGAAHGEPAPHDECCTCPGKCSVVAGSALPSRSTERGAHLLPSTQSRPAQYTSHAPKPPAWILPPANGPPAWQIA
jgi:hypothetical protein